MSAVDLAPVRIWRDRRGRVSPLRLAALALLLFPAALALHAYLTTGFGPRPLNDVIHRTGYWALIFLLVSLAITPLRRIGRFGKLIDVRRMIGVGAFCYAFVHLALYVADQQFDLIKVAAEIAKRLYLTIGLIAWLGLAALAVTSTDGMVRRLGAARWRRLHQAIYAIGVLALVHYFQQTKADVSVPVLAAGLFGWLMLYRLAAGRGDRDLPAWAILGISVAAAALTFAGEAVGVGLAYGVSPLAVLAAAADFSYQIRPGWIVLGAGLAVTALDALRARMRPAARRR